MTNKILVTYATRSGATRGVAEAIGKTLQGGGLQVEVLPIQEVDDVKPYGAVVAGSAIQGGQWLPEAMQFIQGNHVELSRKPFAPFLVCMTLAMKKGDYCDHVANLLNPVCSLVRPVSKGLFAGVLEVRQIHSIGDRIKFRISVMMGIWSEGDHRDWNTIRLWAESLIPLLSH